MSHPQSRKPAEWLAFVSVWMAQLSAHHALLEAGGPMPLALLPRATGLRRRISS
jgi:hypothetical protein